MAALIEAIEIKRRTYFEYEAAPYHCIDVEVSKPTARGGQTLVRIKMRNVLTHAVFEKTFKAAERFKEPDLVMAPASYQYADSDGFHFVELTVAATEMGSRGDTATGGASKLAVLETGLEICVPLFVKEGERVKVHTETLEFSGRA